VIPIAQNVTYPPSAVTFSDPNLTASRFIQQPTFVARALQDFSQLRFVGAQLLKGRQILKGGSLLYELVAGIFADSTAEAVAPGSAYTRGTVSLGAAALVKAQKQGKDYPIEDETLARSNYDALSRVFRMAVNSAEQLVDQTIMAAILSAVTVTQPATAKWDRSGTTPTTLQDILLAKAKITGVNLGYRPDTLLVDDATQAYLASDPTIAAAMAREDRSNPIYSGQFEVLAGLEVINVPTANLPGGVNTAAFVLDSNMLGFIGKEDLGDGYQSAGDLIESKVLRDEDLDGWRVRVRTNFVPVVNNPLAGCKITTVR
jgi:hypothetical protein